MNKLGKCVLVSVYLSVLPFCAYSLPAGLLGDEEGWIEASIGYTFAFPIGADNGGHNLSLSFSVVGADFLGWGGTLRFGQTILEVSANFQQRLLTDQDLSVPIYYKIGIVSPADDEVRLGLGVEAGANIYLNENIDTENLAVPEYDYTFFEVLAGAFASFSPFDEDEQDKLIMIPVGTISVGYASTPRPVSGIQYW